MLLYALPVRFDLLRTSFSEQLQQTGKAKGQVRLKPHTRTVRSIFSLVEEFNNKSGKCLANNDAYAPKDAELYLRIEPQKLQQTDNS